MVLIYHLLSCTIRRASFAYKEVFAYRAWEGRFRMNEQSLGRCSMKPRMHNACVLCSSIGHLYENSVQVVSFRDKSTV